jgi:ketosteroid isomerase-like protein
MPTHPVLALEHAWMTAWGAKDRATLESLLADDFTLTSALGRRWTRAAWLEMAMGPISIERFRWEELEARAVDPHGDVVVVHGRANQRATAEGREWSGAFLVTDVWVRREDRWVVVARHGSALAGNAP